MNPLLDVGDLPRFSGVHPDHVGPAVATAIADHRAAMAACVAATGFDAVFLAKERADARLSRMWQTVSHLTRVVDTPELRAAHEAAQPVLIAYNASVGQDSALFDAIRAIPRDGLSPPETRAIDLAIRNFELSGVALPSAARERFAAISVALGQRSTEFSNAVMDATQSWTLHVTEESRLAGIPAADRAMLAAQAAAKNLDGWLVDLHFPSVRAITTYADDRDLRYQVYEAYSTRASDVGPDAGRFDNSQRMEEIRALRNEGAALLGFPSSAAWLLATRMASDPVEVTDFLLDLAARARQCAEVELAELANFARDMLGLDVLQPWDIAYVSEKLRLRRYSIDDAIIKRHLPLDRVLDGLFDLIHALYGVQIRSGGKVDTYHPDVRYLTLHYDGGDAPFAAMYCDFFARAGKMGGAWMDVCRPRLIEAKKVGMPVAFLVCNFGQAAEGEQTYIAHNDVVTLFHEMGHAMHHLLTEVDIPSVSGIAGVEWDAVELPSQFMENFAWNRAVLRQSSVHAETGEPLCDDVIACMVSARRFLGSLALLRQVEQALFDIRLHLSAVHQDRGSVLEILNAVRAEVAVIFPPSWNRFPHSFQHIFAGGYAAGYYSYLWAERLSADAFEPFARDDADWRALGDLFRQQVLVRGGTRPTLENFVAFRGREPSTKAFLRSWNIASKYSAILGCSHS